MPPRIRARATKVLKENIDVLKKNKVKSDVKISKPPRKALADKTNSLSDDNASIDIPTKATKKPLNKNHSKNTGDNVVRPRRERRLPSRYIENLTLKNLSNSKETETPTKKIPSKKFAIENATDVKRPKKQNKDTNNASPLKVLPRTKDTVSKLDNPALTVNKQVPITYYLSNNDENSQTTTRSRRNRNRQAVIVEKSTSKESLNVTSPFKTSSKEFSLVTNRPKRVHRLPSRFEDHSISPNKFIPVQPCHASTPILQKNIKNANMNTHKDDVDKEIGTKSNKEVKTTGKPVSKMVNMARLEDANNNGLNKVSRPKRVNVKAKFQSKQASPKSNKVTPFAKRLLDKSLSFIVLEENKSNKEGDVYEFTYDPNEEPPQKKKRKRPVKKKPTKPKTVILKCNYDDNVSKALAKLKSRVKPSTVQSTIKSTQNHGNLMKNPVKPNENHVNPSENYTRPENASENVQCTNDKQVTTNKIPQSNYSTYITPNLLPVNDSLTSIHASNYASIRVEDIAAEFEMSHHPDINYSPVSTPHHKPVDSEEIHGITNPALNEDPLNLQEGTSFFEEPPVASSSMNMSVRHPLASPWRVEFGALPLKWHNNTYLKPDMTPAVESSFVNSEHASEKKHVYTNMLSDEPLPEIFENPPALKQTSIISFIKEVAERQANKKKRRRTPSPKKVNSMVENINIVSDNHKTPKKAKTSKDFTPNNSNNSNNTSNTKENSHTSSTKTVSPQKNQKEDKDYTYFGFDETDNLDQENVSPVKNLPKTRLGLRPRNVLQELNAQPLPTRAAMPVNPKSKLTSSEVVEQLYDQLKSTEDAQFPVKEAAKEPNAVTTDVDHSCCDGDDDSQSVHLFEDIDVVHHIKPHRKSYGKSKKITFQQPADSDSDTQPLVTVDPEASSDEDDLADLTFQVPDMKQKKTVKRKPKKQLTKKEEKEVEEWAAGFNSMCEDIDEFPLTFE